MDFREWLLVSRARHEAEIRRIDEQLALIGRASTLPRKTPAACAEIVRLSESPLSPTEVWERLADNGREVALPAVSQALYRLAKVGGLSRLGDGRYAFLAPAAIAG